jgi:GNAT superfamily N-acetyltransferase
MADKSLRFDDNYRERVELDDGTPLVFRVVQPSDKPLLADGLARMSDQSRFRRFFGQKSQLTQPELRYLTELDGQTHFAIGAVRLSESGEEQGVGVARFVRLSDEPTAAEPAIAVVDEFQGKGIGRRLLVRLVKAARERGVDRFRCCVLVDNAPMRAILDQLDDAVVQSEDAELAYVEIVLPRLKLQSPTGVRRTALYELLSLAARDALRFFRAFSWQDALPPHNKGD